MSASDEMYRKLQVRYEEAKLAEASALPDVKVLDPAVPPSAPDSNNRLRLIAMGALGSLGLALALAIMLDRLDRRVRYPDQVEKELGLSILGAVPQIRRRGKLAQSPEEAGQVVGRSAPFDSTSPMLGRAQVGLAHHIRAPRQGTASRSWRPTALSFAESGYKVCR
jgi:hypothetical protein